MAPHGRWHRTVCVCPFQTTDKVASTQVALFCVRLVNTWRSDTCVLQGCWQSAAACVWKKAVARSPFLTPTAGVSASKHLHSAQMGAEVVMVTFPRTEGTRQVSFSNLAGSEVAVLSCSEAAQDTFGVGQREIAERAELELGRVQLVLVIGDVLSDKSATSVFYVLNTLSSLSRSGCVVACVVSSLTHHETLVANQRPIMSTLVTFMSPVIYQHPTTSHGSIAIHQSSTTNHHPQIWPIRRLRNMGIADFARDQAQLSVVPWSDWKWQDDCITQDDGRGGGNETNHMVYRGKVTRENFNGTLAGRTRFVRCGGITTRVAMVWCLSWTRTTDTASTKVGKV